VDWGVEDEEVAGEAGDLTLRGIAAGGREGRRGGRTMVVARRRVGGWMLAALLVLLLVLLLCVEVAVKGFLDLWPEGVEGLFLPCPFPV